MTVKTRLTWLFLATFFCTGFRIYDAEPVWPIDSTSAANSKIFVNFTNGTDTLTNNLPADDVLAGAGATITINQAMASIFNDYNGTQAAFVTLVDTSDGDYNAQMAATRLIEISRSPTDGLNGGQAQFKVESGKVVGCTIKLADSAFENAKAFVAVVTHEIGHCLGLDHAQDTVHAIMSYFYDPQKVVRLQTDDKMGLVYLYPTNPSAAAETSTFGLSCSRR